MSQQINLFNPILQKQKKYFSAVTMAQALGVILLGALTLVYYGKQRVASLQNEASRSAARLAQKQARQLEVNAQFVPRQKDQALAAQIATAQAELQSLQKVSAVLRRGQFGNTLGYSPYFKAFARQSVSGLWLTGLSITGAGNEIGVRGRALQPALVPNYINRLTRESVMQGKFFSALQINQGLQQVNVSQDGASRAAADLAPFIEFSLQSNAAAETAGAAKK